MSRFIKIFFILIILFIFIATGLLANENLIYRAAYECNNTTFLYFGTIASADDQNTCDNQNSLNSEITTPIDNNSFEQSQPESINIDSNNSTEKSEETKQNNEAQQSDSNKSIQNKETEINESPIESNPVKQDYIIDKLNTKNMWHNKVVYLTFDDGPSWITPKILDILKTENIKATFFVVGSAILSNEVTMKRMVEEGHVIGNHTYSHDYKYIYRSIHNFFIDFKKCEEKIFEATSIRPKIIRLPGGSNNKIHKLYGPNNLMYKITKILESDGYVVFDWNADSKDSSQALHCSDQIVDNTLKYISRQNNAIVLFHDCSLKTNTLQALPIIIDKLKFLGCSFDILSTNSFKVKFLKNKSIEETFNISVDMWNKYHIIFEELIY